MLVDAKLIFGVTFVFKRCIMQLLVFFFNSLFWIFDEARVVFQHPSFYLIMGLNTEIIIKGNEDRTTVLHSLAEKHQSNRLWTCTHFIAWLLMLLDWEQKKLPAQKTKLCSWCQHHYIISPEFWSQVMNYIEILSNELRPSNSVIQWFCFYFIPPKKL